MEIKKAHSRASIEILPDKIICSGNWTLPAIPKLSEKIDTLILPANTHLQIDAKSITQLDTAGAFILNQLITHLHAQKTSIDAVHLKEKQQNLLSLVASQTVDLSKTKPPKSLGGIALLGKNIVDRTVFFMAFLNFIGEISTHAMKAFLNPFRLSWQALASTIEYMGVYALPIIALLNFLVGVVLSYQMGNQLQNYGANIYIVDLLGLSVLREFGPLITAIIVAGRTGAAFTAEIGTMMVKEEIDALKTMGINPVDFLCLPKLFAMVLVLPLLTVLGDFFGILGGMLMAKNMLHISCTHFLERFREAIALSNYVVGLVKTPVFAMIITTVGCFQGLQVARRADSVGQQTTKSVVQAIFLIIIVDAFFSILFSRAGI
jgi:phospholipid/cholesterol/gamma-HCH transport system permease protein